MFKVVLEPILLIIYKLYIKDLDQDITSNLRKFADDTKLLENVRTSEEMQTLKNADTRAFILRLYRALLVHILIIACSHGVTKK